MKFIAFNWYNDVKIYLNLNKILSFNSISANETEIMLEGNRVISINEPIKKVRLKLV